jgi:hypothetical protein
MAAAVAAAAAAPAADTPGAVVSATVTALAHPIPTAQNAPVVTLSELITFVSISPSAVWTVYYYLGVQANNVHTSDGAMDISAISTGFPGNPH